MDELAELDELLRTDSALWSALHTHGRERRLEKEMLDEIDGLLDKRLEITNAMGECEEVCDESCVDSEGNCSPNCMCSGGCRQGPSAPRG